MTFSDAAGGGNPDSPRRASTYDHVHNAVAVNFQRALSCQDNTSSPDYNNDDTDKKKKQNSGKQRAQRQQQRPPLGLVGIRNLGNTCYLNSSLQCLSATIPLTDYFLGYEYRSEINHDNPLGTQGKLAVEYAELMKEMWLSTGSSAARKNNHNNNHPQTPPIVVVQPVSFKQQLERFAPQFRGRNQHDSQELLALLLDGIHEDLNRIPYPKPAIEDRDCDGTRDEQDAIDAWRNYLRRDKSLIVDIFQGQLRSKLTCWKCKHSNIRFEPFMYLSLPMSSSCRTVQDCLDLYLREEKMTGANQWYCGKCKKHRNATKKTDLWILPPILIVHLKRFAFDDYGQIGSKNQAPIRYPVEQWDLSRVVRSRGSEHPLYDLYAVSNHVGSLGSGHYTAHAQNRFDDQWYEFNDSTYRAIDASEVNQVHRGNRSSAYVLFYNRTCGTSSTTGSDRGSSNSNSNGSNISTGRFSEQSRNRPEDGSCAASEDTSTIGAGGRLPLIRRQSVNRPDLWPHTQVRDSQFREFSRLSFRKLAGLPPAPPLERVASTDTTSDLGEDDVHGKAGKKVEEKHRKVMGDSKPAPSSRKNEQPEGNEPKKPTRFL